MPKIKVNRFIQDPAHCAVASCACIANSWDVNIDYNIVKKIAYKKISKKIEEEGLSAGQICRLLNIIGFNKVTLVSSQFGIFDYTWAKYRKKRLLPILEQAYKEKKSADDRADMKDILKWYKDNQFNNDIIIDFHFGDYIRESINRGVPVIITFNWTMFFRFSKENEEGLENPVNGDSIEHAVVAYGYDDHGVNICDSHHLFYKYSRKKYRRGFYKIKWEHLMTIMGCGDIYIPEEYNYIEQ